MRLLVTTPMAVVVQADDVRHVRAEDDTGAFGILPHHADFLTVLAISVLSWRNAAGDEHYVAVRGGVLTVRRGALVEVATREAVTGEDLHELERAVLTRFREETATEEASRVAAARLQVAAIRLISRYVRPETAPAPGRREPAHGAVPGEEGA